MTALRPERESDTSYGQQSYGAPGAFEEWSGGGAYGASPRPEPQPQSQLYMAQPEPQPYVPQPEPFTPEPYASEPEQYPASYEPVPDEPYRPAVDEETVALRIPDPPTMAGDPTAGSPGSSATRHDGPAHGGRAARRKASKRRHGRHGGASETRSAQDSAREGRRAPLSRVEARRQARARKPGPAVVASRAVGEVFITTGVLMLLFVTYQLWWTNVRAHAQAGQEASSLQDGWASGKRNPGAFEPGQGFAILHIPKLDVVVPIAEGTSSKGVLDRGMVGHYAEGALKTAMPSDKTGNFGLAGHRNTHGEPFRYINRLTPGDPIVVETQDEYYVYKMASILPVTSPSNTSVLNPVPAGSGFTEPGRYITLTTCTPEFTSKYRMIVWGKMVEERPRSKGKPDALVS
ncbi:class E sortase [Streptomyces azureus]|uniref:Integral membrane protein n=1 Tax=Streptomyces azureus TaxID=146537 RepID=A0A0K8PJ54_STRAJ|nr:class E sortase [Streptomyces azureus]GAP47917.1 integral membrane protein [Streptomyces azureus]